MQNPRLKELRKYTSSIATDFRKAIRGKSPKKDLQQLARRIGSEVKSQAPDRIAELRKLIEDQSKEVRRFLLSSYRKKKEDSRAEKSRSTKAKKHSKIEEAEKTSSDQQEKDDTHQATQHP